MKPKLFYCSFQKVGSTLRDGIDNQARISFRRLVRLLQIKYWKKI